MFGTPKDPGLIPQCLSRIFLHVGYNIDTKVLYKPDGLENLVQTNMNNLQDEITSRKYIFKDDKDDSVSLKILLLIISFDFHFLASESFTKYCSRSIINSR